MLDKFDDNYREVLHRDVHNAYGLLMSATTYAGISERNQEFSKEKGQEYPNRPFLLTRSHFIGSQKFGAFWTGDNQAVMHALYDNFQMMMSAGLSGFGFVGADIPGFYGRPPRDVTIAAYQLGVFYPFFRAHSHLDNK